MKLYAPFIISSRLMPAIAIPDGIIHIIPDGVTDGATQFTVIIEPGDRSWEYVTNELRCPSDDIPSALQFFFKKV